MDRRAASSGQCLILTLLCGGIASVLLFGPCGSPFPSAETSRGILIDGASETATELVLVKVAASPITVSATASPGSGNVPLTVDFRGVASGGVPSTYAWSWRFGDGGASRVQDPSHSYANPGTYTAWVWVNDSTGDTGSGTVAVTVSSLPMLSAVVAGAIAGGGSLLIIALLVLAFLATKRQGKGSAKDAARSEDLPDPPTAGGGTCPRCHSSDATRSVPSVHRGGLVTQEYHATGQSFGVGSSSSSTNWGMSGTASDRGGMGINTFDPSSGNPVPLEHMGWGDRANVRESGASSGYGMSMTGGTSSVEASGKTQTEMSRLLEPPGEDGQRSSSYLSGVWTMAFFGAIFWLVGVGLVGLGGTGQLTVDPTTSWEAGVFLLLLALLFVPGAVYLHPRAVADGKKAEGDNKQVERKNRLKQAIWKSSYYCEKDHVVFRGPLFVSAEDFRESLDSDLGAWLHGRAGGSVQMGSVGAVATAETRPAPSERVVIREIVKVPCKYCGQLNVQTDKKCSSCGANLG
jgi:PKD repeat protein